MTCCCRQFGDFIVSHENVERWLDRAAGPRHGSFVQTGYKATSFVAGLLGSCLVHRFLKRVQYIPHAATTPMTWSLVSAVTDFTTHWGARGDPNAVDHCDFWIRPLLRGITSGLFLSALWSLAHSRTLTSLISINVTAAITTLHLVSPHIICALPSWSQEPEQNEDNSGDNPLGNIPDASSPPSNNADDISFEDGGRDSLPDLPQTPSGSADIDAFWFIPSFFGSAEDSETQQENDPDIDPFDPDYW